MIHPRLNVDRGYTRSTLADRFMIGQSTVITNQPGGGGGGGEEYLSISHTFVALHVLQQHRHVDCDDLSLPQLPMSLELSTN